MKTKKLSALFRILLLISLMSGALSSASAAPLCRDAQKHGTRIESSSLEKRKKIIERNEVPTLSSVINEMVSTGKMIYKGANNFAPGTEFLGSNEGDWLHTPFDNKPTDLMIAFGTNSSWELAVNKRTKDLVIGDWSPYPLMAQAYLVEPMLRISSTPVEFILNLAGLEPEPHLLSRSLDGAFEAVGAFRTMSTSNRLQRTEKFLRKLAENPKISDSELKFLTSYFFAMAGRNLSPMGMGPFLELRNATFADLPFFYKMRYGTEDMIRQNSEASLKDGKKYGALLSQENFNYLKNLYDHNHVKLAWTSITDPLFYAKVAQDYSAKSLSDITLSITNIFDCGCYNRLTFQDLQRYLAASYQALGRSTTQPLTVFRTANNIPPHGFYRYQINTPRDVPQFDEEDSSAKHEHPWTSPRASGL